MKIKKISHSGFNSSDFITSKQYGIVKKTKKNSFAQYHTMHEYRSRKDKTPNILHLGTRQKLVSHSSRSYVGKCRLGGLIVIVLAIVPKARGFSPGHDDGLLKAIKTRSTTSFGVEIKPSIPCRKKLRQGKKNLRCREEILRRKNSRPFLDKFLPASLLIVSSVYCQRALVDESGMIRTKMGMDNRPENGRRAWNALCDTAS
jgi:hypothetical protein